jgi:hypothetical protein
MVRSGANAVVTDEVVVSTRRAAHVKSPVVQICASSSSVSAATVNRTVPDASPGPNRPVTLIAES